MCWCQWILNLHAWTIIIGDELINIYLLSFVLVTQCTPQILCAIFAYSRLINLILKLLRFYCSNLRTTYFWNIRRLTGCFNWFMPDMCLFADTFTGLELCLEQVGSVRVRKPKNKIQRDCAKIWIFFNLVAWTWSCLLIGKFNSFVIFVKKKNS